jgi:hypothetical protein
MEKQMKIKNILTVIFIILGLYVILDFRDHNFQRAIDACVAGSQKLKQPMTIEEAKKFCEDKIKDNN